MKRIVFLLAAASVTVGCASSPASRDTAHEDQWTRASPQKGVSSRQVGMAPYITNGVIVAPGTNWYLGDSEGIRAYMVQGGVRYVQIEPEPYEQKQKASAKTRRDHAADVPDDVIDSRRACSPVRLDADDLSIAFVGSQALLVGDNGLVRRPEARFVTEFASASASVPSGAATRLRQQLAPYRGQRIFAVVAGYTDSAGSDAFNQELSERRANALAKIVAETLGSPRMLVVGKGKCPTVDTNDTPAGRAKNRRAEILIFKEIDR